MKLQSAGGLPGRIAILALLGGAVWLAFLRAPSWYRAVVAGTARGDAEIQADLAFTRQRDIAAAHAFAEQARRLCVASGRPLSASAGWILVRRSCD